MRVYLGRIVELDREPTYEVGPKLAIYRSAAGCDERRGRRGALRYRRAGKGERALREQGDTGAKRQDRKPEPDPVHERVDRDLETGCLIGELVARENDI